MTHNELRKFIDESNGKIFSIKFMKRTTGELREMVCRIGVKKGLVENPTKEGTDFNRHNLICVWDMQKGGYRSIPIDGVTKIKIEGEWEDVHGS